jgi:tRNA pseudouridine38-40 synthase
MRNFRLTLSYDGTDYSGWQTQPGQRTLQQTLEEAIAALTGEPRVRVNASGRTDSGVHAIGQVVNFHSSTHHPAEVLQRAVNARLPPDFVITAAAEVPPDFDANRHALRKLYRYVIHDGPIPSPFLRRYCCHSRHPLEVELMRQGAAALRGTHDFHSFESDWPKATGPTAPAASAPSRTWPSTAWASGSGSTWRPTAFCIIWYAPSPAP